MRRLNGVETLERASVLDALIRPVKRAASRIQHGRVGDALHGVWLGHPAHPAFVQLPIGAWVSSGILDALPGHEQESRRLIQTGLTAALPAVLTGAADWSQQNQRQSRVGFVHSIANGTAIVLYASSLIARSNGRNLKGKLLAYAGLTAVGAGGFLGGHITYRQAGGVNRAEGVVRAFPREWRTAAPLAELPERRLARQTVDGVDLLVVRDGDTVHALIETCSHLAGPLSEGTLVDGGAQLRDACVQCPWHGSTFRLGDGDVVHGPATAPQPVLRTRVRDGVVEVRSPD
ncbi:Rieske (2Fe-2S) protein [Allosalinactinospora lopnorensis]|uniref:Rieske (2Fe-2S) protein n=1 Tax=Allosalinactinospora lopnorensis TaxID=1352348 RepID=UPI000623F807|nr:Rieske (2Fe-2S) protein [Allosalinactinospora lopnorensis]